MACRVLVSWSVGVLPSRQLFVLVLSVCCRHLGCVKAAMTMIPVGTLFLWTCRVSLSFARNGTLTLAMMILGCRCRILCYVSLLLVMSLMILTLDLRCSSVVSVLCITVRLLVSSIWTM